MRHELKCWPEPFRVVKSGQKKAEFRLNDRDYKEGDLLVLGEWDPIQQTHTGDGLVARVTHVQHGSTFGIPAGYVMMSIELV